MLICGIFPGVLSGGGFSQWVDQAAWSFTLHNTVQTMMDDDRFSHIATEDCDALQIASSPLSCSLAENPDQGIQ